MNTAPPVAGSFHQSLSCSSLCTSAAQAAHTSSESPAFSRVIAACKLAPGCCLPGALTGSKGTDQALSVQSCVCHHPSGQPARGSACVLRTGSLFHSNSEKLNHNTILPSAPSHSHQAVSTPTPTYSSQMCSQPLWAPQRHTWRTHLCSSCCHFQPLLLLLFIPSLLKGAIKQTLLLENPSALPQSLPF